MLCVHLSRILCLCIAMRINGPSASFCGASVPTAQRLPCLLCGYKAWKRLSLFLLVTAGFFSAFGTVLEAVEEVLMQFGMKIYHYRL